MARWLGLLALAACSSAPAATADFFGPTIEPPRGLLWIHPGMTGAEAMRLVPGLHEPDTKGVRDELILDSGVGDVRLTVRLDAGTVSGIVAIVQGHTARDLLTGAWGPPEITKDSLGQPEITWASEVTGWKVKLDCLERNCLVEYEPYHVLTAEFFGAHVIPPGDLAKLRIGMKLAEARSTAPALVAVLAVRAGIPTNVDGVREFVAIDDKLGTVQSIYLNLPQHAEELIASVWSEGQTATEPVGKTVLVWPDPTTGWRGTLRDALGYSKDLVYDNYLPASQLFGDQPDQMEGLPHPILGHTVDEVKQSYKDQFVQQGKELALVLPPTEWERVATRIALYPAGGKIAKLELEIPYKPHPESRETLLEMFKRKWGEPKDLADDGRPSVLLFHEDDPRVEIRDDAEHGAWQIDMR
ncbi:MAG TPA: hypothetical protein VGG74_37680 [Kofleriaceae bacterium]|jgi:hypothetical protein